MDPKVTIVIPVYNGANYIKYAIESALSQTYAHIEILVVDDGSTDDTGDIVRSYGDKVRYINKKNGGVSSALNLALKEMTGKYFSWLSHDDVYEPNKIKTEIEFLRSNNWLGKKVIVFSDYYLINTKGKIIGESKKDHEEIEKKPEYILLKGHINGLSLLIPKMAFDEYGEFDTELVCTQDYEMWKRMSKTYRFVHIPEFLVSTRWHANQVTNTNEKVITEGNEFYINLIKDVPLKRREELEGSEYSFMMELADFYKSSVYNEVEKYCRDRAREILDAAKSKTKDKKVSVVIPFYNRAKVLVRAVESVLEQTHKNYEIILVDDGSTDDVKEIEKIASKYDQIKLIKNKKNMGASAARNIGIGEASGDYVAFLDSDDEYVANKFEIQLQYMVAAKAKFSHTSYERRIDGVATVIKSGEIHGHAGRRLMYNCPIATPTVMVDREWFVSGGYKFRDDIEIGEDTCLWLTLMKDNVYLIGINQPLSIVNVGENAAAYTAEKQVNGLKSIIKYLINDDYYAQYDMELALLMDAYSSYVKKIAPVNEMMDGGAIRKFIFFAKQEGVKSAFARTAKKIRSILVRK